jgi:hypothetical protein
MRFVQSKAASNTTGSDGARLTELKASAYLLTLEAGLFYIGSTPGSAAPRDGSGLPGVRVSPAPGVGNRVEAVSIASFRDDGWLGGPDDAALVRVLSGSSQVLVTIYQSPGHGAEAAPRLRVERLGAEAAPTGPSIPASLVRPASPPDPELIAHVSRSGDVGARIGEWVGVRGSRQWIEGFAIAPKEGPGFAGLRPNDIEYQAVLGRGWLSPWVEGGTFCGSRGMALPMLGVRVRLRGAAAEAFDCSYSATFVDGTAVGPVPAGEACEAESLAALEAFQVVLTRKAAAAPAPIQRVKPAPAPAAPRTARVLKSARQSR